jgi:hypothetical protein
MSHSRSSSAPDFPALDADDVGVEAGHPSEPSTTGPSRPTAVVDTQLEAPSTTVPGVVDAVVDTPSLGPRFAPSAFDPPAPGGQPAVARQRPIRPEDEPVDWSRAWLCREEELEREYVPPEPVLDPIVVRGKLVVVAARMGTGKTWLLHDGARAVVEQRSVAGLQGHGGRALLLDGELGRRETVKRLREHGWPEGLEVIDANGWDLGQPRYQEALKLVCRDLEPVFIGIDSLRALTPRAKENESDSMVPIMRFLANLAHDPHMGEPAIVLAHHEGWGEKRARGSISIGDQADAVFGMHEGADGVIEITASKAGLKPPNWGRAPAPLFVRVAEAGGLEAAAQESIAAKHRRTILDAVPVASMTACAAACGTKASHVAWRAAWDALLAEGILHEVDGQWHRNGKPAPSI